MEHFVVYTNQMFKNTEHTVQQYWDVVLGNGEMLRARSAFGIVLLVNSKL